MEQRVRVTLQVGILVWGVDALKMGVADLFARRYFFHCNCHSFSALLYTIIRLKLINVNSKNR